MPRRQTQTETAGGKKHSGSTPRITTITCIIYGIYIYIPNEYKTKKNIIHVSCLHCAGLCSSLHAGESEAVVKKELQTKKAMANEERKRSAEAVSQRAQKQEQVAKSRAKAKAGPKAAAAAPAGTVDQGLEDATNKGYYLEIQADIQTVVQEFGGQAFCEALPLQIGSDASQSGVQEPFNRSKALQALAAHGTYRSSINIAWVNGLQSATPGIPMARKRTEDLTDFYFGDGTPHFHAERMFECAVRRSDEK